MNYPDVSVIIPHYNADRFIRKAAASVVRQTVARTIKELMIVDDGSDEESWERTRAITPPVEKFLFFVRHSEHRSQGFALNYGVDRTIGTIIMFLDADDVWTPGKVELQLKAFEDPSVDIVTGHAQNFRGDKYGEPMAARITSALAIRASAMAKVGPFREDLGAGMTIEWFERASHMTKIVVPEEVVVQRRLHDDNYGVRNREQAKREYLAALKIIEDRNREATD